MKKSGALIAAIAALCLSACATAPAEEIVATVENGVIPTAEVKKVCRKETPTGQTIPVKTCKTREEWVAYDKSTVEGRRTHEDAVDRDGGFIR